MDTTSLLLAYAAAAAVGAVVTAAFSPSINIVLTKLIPGDLVPAWNQFTRFALFVASFAGGIPNPNPGRFIDRNAPAVAPPVEGEGLMMVMRAIGGALMAASWTLLIFFGVTLAAYGAGRVWTAIKQRRDEDAKEVERREQERREAKAKQDASSSERIEARKRLEPAEPRPVQKDESSQRPVPKDRQVS